jgi:iron complex transport system substrate-binding protein
VAPVDARLTRRTLLFGVALLPFRTAFGAALQGAARSGFPAIPQRIISLVPATTEMIYAMGAESRLVGVSSYDRFPPAAMQLPQVGGLIDPNTERILALRPDLVIVYATQEELIRRLERAGVSYYLYEHRALPDIMATIRSIGARIGAAARADAVASGMERDIAAVRTSVAGRARPLTLLVFAREPGSLRNIFASGGYGFLADLLDAAGGENVFAAVKRQSVQVSTEMLLTRRPEVIIELRYGQSAETAAFADAAAAWNAVPSVPAVKHHHIHELVGDEFVVPGPRGVIAAQKFARALHPEAFK